MAIHRHLCPVVVLAACGTLLPGAAPPGKYARKADPPLLARTAFHKGQPIAGTYYFYWYDSHTKAHFIDADGTDALTDHPASSDDYSYRSAPWHRRQLLDILDAGLDFILPVYWGFPGDYESWSFAGIPPLVEACRLLEKEGRKPPRIGLFYDTSTLRSNSRGYHADLTTPRGKTWLYESARDFFSMVPHDLWATIEGRPILWLYAAGFAKRQDPAALDSLRASFEKDFGVEPFIVKEISWQGRADATYAWGAALRPTMLGIAAVGPGYDHSAVPGRAPLVRDREGGAFYCRSWEWILSREPSRRPSIAIVETWNELHEGTEIAETREYGRRYIDLTRKYTDLWHAGKKVVRSGRYARAKEVSVALGSKNREAGLVQKEQADGKTAPVQAGGKEGRKTAPTIHSGRFVYFDVDDSFYYDDDGPLEIEVEFLDDRKGSVRLEYDSLDPKALHAGAFKPARDVAGEGTGTWKIGKFRIEDAAFVGRANGADFRLSAAGPDLILRRVVVRKIEKQR